MMHDESPQPTTPTAPAKQKEHGPLEPVRVKAFAHFFKNYMSVSAVVAAALPIPVTSFKLIPTFAAQTPLLSTYTSLFCFLLLAFIFYSRHALGRAMFPQDSYRIARIRAIVIGIAPAALIFASLVCVYCYHVWLSKSVSAVGSYSSSDSTEILQKLPLWKIPDGEALMFWYLGVFVFAEAAFIMMALREYLQDLLKIQEEVLIHPPVPERSGFVERPELLRTIADYRRVIQAGKWSYDNFLEWAAEEQLDQLVNAIEEAPQWQQEIRKRLASKVEPASGR